MATQGSPLTPEFKRAIVLLKDYFDRTKGDSREQDCSSAQRAAHALGVGIATVKRVMADSNRNPDVLEREVSLRRGRPPRAIADSLQTITRDSVRQANREGAHITLEMLAAHLKEEGCDPNFSVRTLGRTLERWGLTIPFYAFGLFSCGLLVYPPCKCLQLKDFRVYKAPVVLQTKDDLLHRQPPFAYHP